MKNTIPPGPDETSKVSAPDLSSRKQSDQQVGLEALPFIPSPSLLWRSLRFWIWTSYIVLILAAVPPIIVDYWFFQSIGKEGIFWTNFGTQLLLFLTVGALFTLGEYLPIRSYATSPTLRSAGIHIGLWFGIFAGWLVAREFLTVLAWKNGQLFGQTDPVFGKDIGFYVFSLPAYKLFLATMFALGLDAALAFIIARYDQIRSDGAFDREDISFWSKAGMLITPGFNIAMTIVGFALVLGTYISKYGLLFKDNEDSGVRVGAEYLDVTGLFSTLNMIYLSTLMEFGIMLAIGAIVLKLAKHYESVRLKNADPGSTPALKPALKMLAAFVIIDLGFYVGVSTRDHVFVAPNEPSIQVPYIQRHMDATLSGYGLNDIKTVHWKPPQEKLSAAQLMASKTVKNAPILTPWVSKLEEPPDVQHLQRITASETTTVYGPLLQTFDQEQQLRPYYEFISIDGVRYNVDGEKKMYVTAARELPSLAFVGPKEWLRYWGTAALLLTHGMGLVMAPANEITAEGGPVYVSHSVPPVVTNAAFEHEPRFYFGEGLKDDYILTNINHLKELDYATPQSRQEFEFPADVKAGIPVDSWFKRFIIGLDTKDITSFWFSTFINHDKTRVQVYRTPIRRAQRIAPFLFLDTNSYAFIADKKVLWMVNGLTSTDMYPYSYREALGDKADERAIEKFPERMANYAEDSVKITMDAFTGETRFYKISDSPIVNTWAKTYPELFDEESEMPQAVRAQLTYPLQWFHLQFDDIYKRYHQRNPIEFYNVEDLWDDADETLGSLGRGLTEFGTTDQMTFSYEGDNLLIDPADLPAGSDIGKAGELQYAMVMPFTPEGGRNLRSLVIALQDPGNYGKLLNLRVPQGEWLMGPEQVDAAIDADAQVNQQITLWVRHGSEVVRGHTLIVPVAGDVMYIEPLWIVSLQNEIPEVKLFSVVYRGRTTMSTSLEEAIKLQDIPEAEEQKMNELPWFEEALKEGK